VDILDRLASQDYDGVIRRCARSRLSARDLATCIGEYGRRVTGPPAGAFDRLDAVAVKAAPLPTWFVRAPLWTAEEGRSDLELQLTATLRAGAVELELDDLRVP